MATKKQKEQLMQTLKFTPRDYKIEIGRYGGEVYFGSVDRKIYDFFKEHKIDIAEYASDWDDEKWEFVPPEMRPFEPGAPYDCDNLAHQSGADFDSGNTIYVYDENGEEVWSCELSIDALEAAGVTVECSEEVYISEQEEGAVVFYGAQGEKGCLFGNEFHLTAPFDPGNLTVTYGDFDGWEMVTGVLYLGEDIDNYNMDTTGKWGDAKWIIVGDEEPYEGVAREDVEDNDDGTSDEDNDIFADLLSEATAKEDDE